jgi:hypothetical protein
VFCVVRGLRKGPITRPQKCGVSDCDHETSSRRRSRPSRAVEPLKNPLCYMDNKKVFVSHQHHNLKEFYREGFNNFRLLNNDTNVNIITDMSKS